ncbi:MAG TPA: hypothetical protein VGE60_07620 [Telluria sp.]
MRKQIFQRLAGAVAVGLVCASTAQVALADHAWSNYHWARTTPQFTLQLGNNLTSADWRGHLSQASSDWNNNGNTPVLTAIVGGSTNSKKCAMVAGTTQVCNASYGARGWLGLASINISGGHITQGTAKMNDTYFSTATYNNPNERLHVMCQEIAHTYGLAHQSEDGSSQNSCMDYFSNTGANAGSTLSTKPNAHDFEQLELIYNHLDATNSYAALGSGSTATRRSDIDITDDPSSWGQLMRQSENGRSSTYERNNKDGSITVTHVTWTNEAAEKCPSCDHRRDFIED